MDDRVDVGKRLLHFRKDVMNQSQEEFAEYVDVTPETISNLERGVVYPSIETLAKIAEACGITTDYILNIKQDAGK